MPAAHDRGGWTADQPIDRSEHQWMDWERQANVLPSLLERKGVMRVDELRRGIESLPAEEYERLSYFERWSASIELILVEKGVLSQEEIDAKAKAVEEHWG